MSASQPDRQALGPTPFTIHLDQRSSGQVRARLEGELDLATAPQLKQAVHEQLAAGNHLVLDLGTLQFVDSSGLEAILVSVKEAESLPGTLRISPSIPPQVHRLLEIAGVLGVLPFVED